MFAEFINKEYENFKSKEKEITDLAKAIHPKLIQQISYVDLYQDKNLEEVEYSTQYNDVIVPKVRELKNYHSAVVKDLQIKVVNMFISLGLPVGVNLETGNYIFTLKDFTSSNIHDIKFDHQCFCILESISSKFLYSPRTYEPFWRRNHIYNSLSGTFSVETYNKSKDYIKFAKERNETVPMSAMVNVGLVERLAKITKSIPYDIELDVGKSGHLTNRTSVHDILRESIRVAELTKLLYLHKTKTKKD